MPPAYESAKGKQFYAQTTKKNKTLAYVGTICFFEWLIPISIDAYYFYERIYQSYINGWKTAEAENPLYGWNHLFLLKTVRKKNDNPFSLIKHLSTVDFLQNCVGFLSLKDC